MNKPLYSFNSYQLSDGQRVVVLRNPSLESTGPYLMGGTVLSTTATHVQVELDWGGSVLIKPHKVVACSYGDEWV